MSVRLLLLYLCCCTVLLSNISVSAANLSPAREPNNLLGVWSYSIIADVTSLAVFTDGSFTYDIEGVFDLGVTLSRQQNPEDWGVWRVRTEPDGDQVLDLKLSNESQFTDHLFWWKNIPGNQNQKLNHCYTNLAFSDGGPGSDGDVFVGASKTWCFIQQGYFASKVSSFGVAPGVAISGPGAALQGSYRIDGHAMKLKFANGQEKTFSFVYTLPERVSIRINQTRYSRGRSTQGITVVTQPPTLPPVNKNGVAMAPIIDLLMDNSSRYSGTQTLRLIENGIPLQDINTMFILTVDGSNVSITDQGIPPSTAKGTLQNKQFIASSNQTAYPLSANIECQNKFDYSGSVTDSSATGTIAGVIECSNSQTFAVNGHFSAIQ